MKNKRLEIVTCRLAGHGPECPQLDPGLEYVIIFVGIRSWTQKVT